MFCRQTFEVWQPLKQTVVPQVRGLYVFDQRMTAHISFFSSFRYISRSLRNSTLASEIILNVQNYCKDWFCWAKTNQVDNSRLLQTLNVWRQNMSRLHPIRTCFFLTCTCLDATDGKLDQKKHTVENIVLLMSYYAYKCITYVVAVFSLSW